MMLIAGRTLWLWQLDWYTPWDCAVMEPWLLRGGITTVNAMSIAGRTLWLWRQDVTTPWDYAVMEL